MSDTFVIVLAIQWVVIIFAIAALFRSILDITDHIVDYTLARITIKSITNDSINKESIGWFEPCILWATIYVLHQILNNIQV